MWQKALLRRTGAVVAPPWSIGIEPVRGNLAVCMGNPGVGKSVFTLNWALLADYPSVVISLDTDVHTQAVRAASILTGHEQSRVRDFPGAYSLLLKRKLKHCRIFDISLRTKDINDLLIAEEEYWGEPPPLVIVDNISNIVAETSYEAYRNVFIELQKVARMRDTFIIACHHIRRGSSTAKSQRLSLHSGQYAGEQEAEMVLGLWRSDRGIEVGVLKNRNGIADPDGGLSFPVVLNGETMRVTERKWDGIQQAPPT